MKAWHRLEAWYLERKIRKEHHQLARYVRRSAHEINAWKQDISFLEESRDYHRSFFTDLPAPAPDKVVSIDDAKENSPTEKPSAPRSAAG